MEALAQLIGEGKAIGWFDALNIAALPFSINTPLRMAAWLGQLMEESGKFQHLEEDLDYSADSLLRVFPTHFTPAEAQVFAHKPETIANRAYADRMGNGNEASGDGWRYHGRGLIQLTGKENYAEVSHGLNYDFINDPEALLQTDNAALSAAWFWKKHGCNELADKKDYVAISKAINGGLEGVGVRIAYTSQALDILA